MVILSLTALKKGLKRWAWLTTLPSMNLSRHSIQNWTKTCILVQLKNSFLFFNWNWFPKQTVWNGCIAKQISWGIFQEGKIPATSNAQNQTKTTRWRILFWVQSHWTHVIEKKPISLNLTWPRVNYIFAEIFLKTLTFCLNLLMMLEK